MAKTSRYQCVLLLTTLCATGSTSKLTLSRKAQEDPSRNSSLLLPENSEILSEAWQLHRTAGRKALLRSSMSAEDQEAATTIFGAWKTKVEDLLQRVKEVEMARTEERRVAARHNAELKMELELTKETLNRTAFSAAKKSYQTNMDMREMVNIVTNIYIKLLEERSNTSKEIAYLHSELAKAKQALNQTDKVAA
mmetsp:Transcript_80401/g.236543  ORF Transcript_80401/g.236543 Transcript_80401/m.236543 type:complete len:194 (+) Transcript_80401:105-686(+)